MILKDNPLAYWRLDETEGQVATSVAPAHKRLVKLAWKNLPAGVTAPAEVQRKRVLMRPGMTAEKLDALLAKQMPDSEKRARADFIVDSGGGLEKAGEQVRTILAKIAKMPKGN